jgi:epoxide hydrolase-like predicted phosphatase
MTLSIKAVLFDFGGVFTLSPFGAVEQFAREHAQDSLALAETIFGPYHLDTDHPWHQLERGEISLESAREGILQVSRKSGFEVDLWDVLTKMAHHNGGQMVNAQVVQLLREVKQQGYRTAIVTNNVKEFSTAWQGMIPMEHVDVVVDSAFEGIRKPDAAIFHRTLERLRAHPQAIALDPAHCVFLDDVPSNVASAINVGMHGIVVTPNPDETVANLRKLLGT